MRIAKDNNFLWSCTICTAAILLAPLSGWNKVGFVDAASEAFRIDGGDEFGWDRRQWYVQVDGVMGGKSSGSMEFLSSNNVMKFTGDIVLDGGGFSSVRRGINLDLSDYSGIVVTLEAEPSRSSVPTGLHLQFGDRSSYYDYSSALAVPLSSGSGNSEKTVTSVYLPIDSFDRGTRFGFQCRNNCRFDASRIDGMSVYVLFQEGSFDVRLLSIEAVKEPRSFAPPAYSSASIEEETISLLRSTIESGSSLYDKSYIEICIAMYWSVLNTLLASTDSSTNPLTEAVICAGLQRAEGEMSSKQETARILRSTLNALVDDLSGSDRRGSTPAWLPSSASEAPKTFCVPRTSPAPGILYDPTNQFEIIATTDAGTDSESKDENETMDEVSVDEVESAGDEIKEDPEQVPEESESEDSVSPPSARCKTIAELACSETDLSTLCQLVTDLDLAETLSNSTWTVFAPINEAFAAVQDDLLDDLTPTQVADVLSFHLVDSTAIRYENLRCRGLLSMRNGETSRTKCEDDNGVESKFQKGSGQRDGMLPKIVRKNIEACNGIIHVVDNVLIPNL